MLMDLAARQVVSDVLDKTRLRIETDIVNHG